MIQSEYFQKTFPLCIEVSHTCSYTFLPWAPSLARHAPNALLSFCCDLHSGKQASKFSASWYCEMVCYSQRSASATLLEPGFQVGITATECRKQELFCSLRWLEETEMWVWAQFHSFWFLTSRGLIQEQYSFRVSGLEPALLNLSMLW